MGFPGLETCAASQDFRMASGHLLSGFQTRDLLGQRIASNHKGHLFIGWVTSRGPWLVLAHITRPPS